MTNCAQELEHHTPWLAGETAVEDAASQDGLCQSNQSSLNKGVFPCRERPACWGIPGSPFSILSQRGFCRKAVAYPCL